MRQGRFPFNMSVRHAPFSSAAEAEATPGVLVFEEEYESPIAIPASAIGVLFPPNIKGVAMLPARWQPWDPMAIGDIIGARVVDCQRQMHTPRVTPAGVGNTWLGALAYLPGAGDVDEFFSSYIYSRVSPLFTNEFVPLIDDLAAYSCLIVSNEDLIADPLAAFFAFGIATTPTGYALSVSEWHDGNVMDSETLVPIGKFQSSAYLRVRAQVRVNGEDLETFYAFDSSPDGIGWTHVFAPIEATAGVPRVVGTAAAAASDGTLTREGSVAAEFIRVARIVGNNEPLQQTLGGRSWPR